MMSKEESIGIEVQEECESLETLFKKTQETLDSFNDPAIYRLKQSLEMLKIHVYSYIEERKPKEEQEWPCCLFWLFIFIFHCIKSLIGCSKRNTEEAFSLLKIESEFIQLKKSILAIKEKITPHQEIIEMIEMIKRNTYNLLSKEYMAMVPYSLKKDNQIITSCKVFFEKTTSLFNRILSELNNKNLCLSDDMRCKAIQATKELRDICKVYKPNSNEWKSFYKSKKNEIKRKFHPDLYHKEKKGNDLDSANKLFPMFEGVFTIIFNLLENISADIEINELLNN